MPDTETITPDELERMFDEVSNWGRWGPEDERGALNLIHGGEARGRRCAGARRHRRQLRARAAEARGAGQPDTGLPLDARRGRHRTPRRAPRLFGLLCGRLARDGRYAPRRALPRLPARQDVERLRRLAGHEPRCAAQLDHGRPRRHREPRRDARHPRAARHAVPRAARADLHRRRRGCRGAGGRARRGWRHPARAHRPRRTTRRVRPMVADRGRARRDGRRGHPWLHERDVAVLGGDGISDPLPDTVPGWANPIHQIALVSMGVHLIDNMQLGRLAAACAERECWEFLLTIAPLRLDQGTASPVNPIAMF